MNLNKLISLLSQRLLAPLNRVSKLICVEDGGLTPIQMPLFKPNTGLLAASCLLLTELSCRGNLDVQSFDVDGATLAPTGCKTIAPHHQRSRLYVVAVEM